MMESDVENPSQEKRSVSSPTIVIPIGARLIYENFVIKVVKDGVWLHKFQNIQVLQTYNRINLYETFYTSADRDFPGLGTYAVCSGTVT